MKLNKKMTKKITRDEKKLSFHTKLFSIVVSLSCLFSPVARAGGLCEELFLTPSSQQVDPTELSQKMLEILNNPQDKDAEDEVIRMYATMINSADEKLSAMITELGRNPLLTASFSSQKDATLLTLKLSKDLVRLQKATQANPKLLEKVLGSFKIHSEERIQALEKSIQQRHFDAEEARVRLQTEIEFYKKTQGELSFVLSDLDHKITVTEALLGQLEHAQVFANLPDQAQSLLKSQILPYVSEVLRSMVSIYTVAHEFNSSLPNRIATNKRLTTEIKQVTVNILPAVVMSTARPLDLRATDHRLHPTEESAEEPPAEPAAESQIHSEPEVAKQPSIDLRPPLEIGQLVYKKHWGNQLHQETVRDIDAEGSVKVSFTDGYFSREAIAVYDTKLNSGGYSIGDRVMAGGNSRGVIVGIFPNGEVAVDLGGSMTAYAIKYLTPDVALPELNRPLKVGEKVRLKSSQKIRTRFVSRILQNNIIELENGFSFSREEIALTDTNLASGGFSVGQRVMAKDGKTGEISGLFPNGDVAVDLDDGENAIVISIDLLKHIKNPPARLGPNLSVGQRVGVVSTSYKNFFKIVEVKDLKANGRYELQLKSSGKLSWFKNSWDRKDIAIMDKSLSSGGFNVGDKVYSQVKHSLPPTFPEGEVAGVFPNGDLLIDYKLWHVRKRSSPLELSKSSGSLASFAVGDSVIINGDSVFGSKKLSGKIIAINFTKELFLVDYSDDKESRRSTKRAFFGREKLSKK